MTCSPHKSEVQTQGDTPDCSPVGLPVILPGPAGKRRATAPGTAGMFTVYACVEEVPVNHSPSPAGAPAGKSMPT